jgi:hypothetical protein
MDYNFFVCDAVAVDITIIMFLYIAICICVLGYLFCIILQISIGFCKCSNSVVLFVFHYLSSIYFKFFVKKKLLLVSHVPVCQFYILYYNIVESGIKQQ